MGIILDFLPAIKKHEIRFIRKQQMEGNVVAFEFEPTRKIKWKAGQHSAFLFHGVKVKGLPFRDFSIASGPNENIIRFATLIKESPSNFKAHLMSLKEGDIMVMWGPFGPFYIKDKEKPLVFIAGGIGITPFMGLFRNFNIDNSSMPKSVVLVYNQSENQHAFRNEIESLCSGNDNIKLHFVTHKEESSEIISAFVNDNLNKGTYFISGTGKMIRNVKKLLKSKGIHRKNRVVA